MPWRIPAYLKVMALLLPLWVAVLVHTFFLMRVSGHAIPLMLVLRENVSIYLAMFAIVPLPLWAARKAPLDEGGWRFNLLKHAGILPVFGALDYLIERTLFLAVVPSYALNPYLVHCRLSFMSGHIDGLLATLAIASPFYILTVVAHYAFNYHHDLQERALRSAQMEAQYSESRLETLKNQLRPHFLFNALNTIYSHIPPNAETALRLVVMLSSFLRRSLREMGLQKVALRQEVEMASLYLDIQLLRFSNKLKVEWDVEEEILDSEVPHLILQP